MTLASLLGAALSAVLFLSFPVYSGAVGLMAFGVVPLMLFAAFGYGGMRQFLLRIGVSWLSIVIVNGVATAVFNLTGIRSLYVYVCLLVLLMARMLVASMLLSLKRQKTQLPVQLTKNGKTICCMGLYDSGNLLKIPMTGEPVHILAPGLLQKLMGEDCESQYEKIPYHALGTSEGQIFVCQLEQMQIQMGGESKTLDHPWVGRADVALLRGKSYQVILNSEIVDNR